jgi:hypothetical protein
MGWPVYTVTAIAIEFIFLYLQFIGHRLQDLFRALWIVVSSGQIKGDSGIFDRRGFFTVVCESGVVLW